MIGIGAKLKEERLNKNLSLAEIEQRTKIRIKYLDALEKENFGVLPGSVYIKGFIKTYAKLLELDPQDLIALYEQSEMPKEEEELPPKGPYLKKEPSSNRNYLKIVLGILAILTLIGLQEVYPTIMEKINPEKPNQGLEENREPGNGEQGGLIEEPGLNEPVDENGTNEENQNRLILSIEILDQTCWVRVTADGVKAYEKTMAKGEKEIIKARDKIEFTLGNAGVARVLLNEQDLGSLGQKGEVISQSFTKDKNL